jgi:hypothetical protein
MSRLKLASINNKLQETECRIERKLLLPPLINRELHEELSKRKLALLKSKTHTTSELRKLDQKIKYDEWAKSKEGRTAYFLANEKAILEGPKRANEWLSEQFLKKFPQFLPKSGRPPGVAPHKEQKILLGDIVSEALEMYFRKLQKTRKANEK